MLKVARELSQWRPVEMVTSYLGAHALPPEFKDNRQGYVDLVCDEVLPAVAAIPVQAQALQVQRGDALAVMARQPAQAFDLVFLDPPFDTPRFAEALQSAARLVPVGGWVYLEAPKQWLPPMPPCNKRLRQLLPRLKLRKKTRPLLKPNPPSCPANNAKTTLRALCLPPPSMT